jgi:broad specificity phosphatase PhoE
VCQGQVIDGQLDAVGLVQARRAGFCLRELPIEALFCSQLHRAAKTARDIGEANLNLQNVQHSKPAVIRKLNKNGYYGSFEGFVFCIFYSLSCHYPRTRPV